MVLLGHNGAGKTTTISMLTGLEKATKGTARINIDNLDIDLFKDYGDIVDFIGVCPQHDVLFEKMTVKENLIFFCQFKNVPDAEVVIDDILVQYNLMPKANTLTADLSGG